MDFKLGLEIWGKAENIRDYLCLFVVSVSLERVKYI